MFREWRLEAKEKIVVLIERGLKYARRNRQVV